MKAILLALLSISNGSLFACLANDPDYVAALKGISKMLPPLQARITVLSKLGYEPSSLNEPTVFDLDAMTAMAKKFQHCELEVGCCYCHAYLLAIRTVCGERNPAIKMHIEDIKQNAARLLPASAGYGYCPPVTRLRGMECVVGELSDERKEAFEILDAQGSDTRAFVTQIYKRLETLPKESVDDYLYAEQQELIVLRDIFKRVEQEDWIRVPDERRGRDEIVRRSTIKQGGQRCAIS